MRQNRSQYAILSLLRLGSLSGYEIKANCQRYLRDFWSESYGSIYPMLARLERDGSIRACDDAQRKGSERKRRNYKLTAAGRKALRNWLIEPPVPRSVRDEMMLKLMCATAAPAEVHIHHLRRLRSELQEHQRGLAVHDRHLKTEHADSPDYGHWHLIIRAGMLVCAARLTWCDEAIAVLEGGKKSPRGHRTSRSKKNGQPTR